MIRCKMACATIRNMGIYDGCEKDVKACRPHLLKPKDSLLTTDKDLVSLFVCLLVFTFVKVS